MKAGDTFKVGPFAGRPHLRSGEPSGKWQLDIPPRFSPSGKRERRMFSSRREAFENATYLNRQLRVRTSIMGPDPLPSGVRFSELAKEWMDEQVRQSRAGLKRASSVDTAAFQLKALLVFFGKLDLQEINEAKVLEYQRHRREGGRKPVTINSELAKLKQVMALAVERKLCSAVPRIRSLPTTHRRLDLPTQEEMALIINRLSIADALLVRFFCETGCRKSEVFHLRWRDVDVARCLIQIRAKDGFTPKTAHSERSIPVDQSLIAALNKARGKRGPDTLVFPGKGGVVRTEIEKALNTAAKAAKVRRGDEPIRLTHHILRKAHASWQAMKGLPESVLQARLGHVPGSRVTQQVYVHAMRGSDLAGVITLPVMGGRRFTTPKNK